MNELVRDMDQGRDLFGRMAIQLGYVSTSQLDEALQAQQQASRDGFRKTVGSVLIELGHLNEVQRQVILAQQKATPVAVRIAGFEVIGKLGAGGMGTVYKARQVSLDRIVALKVLRNELARDAMVRERFLAEARAVARLSHPNIVAGISVGCEGGQYFFAMEYVDGESLAEQLLVHQNGLPERRAMEYARQVALALQHAHNRRLLHRDIKPENILLTSEGQAKLTDLGLARVLDRKQNKRITSLGLTVGTPHYVSPEQAQGAEKLTRATDLYTLGATLYHLLTGQVPYEGRTSAAVMIMHISDPVPDPRSIRSSLSPAASAICMKLMQKNPRERYPSAIRLAEDLERYLNHEPLRGVEMSPHMTSRLMPVREQRVSGSDHKPGSPKRLRAARRQGGGLDRIVNSIVKRLGL